MKEEHKADLNYFFVTVFNQILTWEERTLIQAGFDRLSVKEHHVLEAVARLTPAEKNTMTNIAGALSISVSALTIAVNALVRKGYLSRASDPSDRRFIRLSLTDEGCRAEAIHRRFHEEMIEEVAAYMEPEQMETLVLSLNRLRSFFANKRKE